MQSGKAGSCQPLPALFHLSEALSAFGHPESIATAAGFTPCRFDVTEASHLE